MKKASLRHFKNYHTETWKSINLREKNNGFL